jgi:hypothetical protein
VNITVTMATGKTATTIVTTTKTAIKHSTVGRQPGKGSPGTTPVKTTGPKGRL